MSFLKNDVVRGISPPAGPEGRAMMDGLGRGRGRSDRLTKVGEWGAADESTGLPEISIRTEPLRSRKGETRITPRTPAIHRVEKREKAKKRVFKIPLREIASPEDGAPGLTPGEGILQSFVPQTARPVRATR